MFGGLSLAIDLAEGKHLQHAQSVAYIACRLGEQMKLSRLDMEALYYAGLLHDISFTSKSNLCPVCQAIEDFAGIDLFPALYCADNTIHLSQETWDGRGPRGLTGNSIPLLSRILRIAIAVEDSSSGRRDFYNWRFTIEDLLHSGTGKDFDPKIILTFRTLLSQQRFSLDLLNPNYCELLLKYRPETAIDCCGQTMNIFGNAFALFIDQKTAYTANHSKDVAQLSKDIAYNMGLNETQQMDLYLGGLLHDLGKIAIPNKILEKQGPLTDAEFIVIKNQPYYTAAILDTIPELRELGMVASLHHEKLNGEGYYLGLKENSIPLESRIIAVADVFAALTVDRPYRKALDLRMAESILRNMGAEQQLDSTVVEALISSINCNALHLNVCST